MRNGLVFVASASTVVVVLLSFLFLNYFNVLSLSEMFPRQLGWLPQRTSLVEKSRAGQRAVSQTVRLKASSLFTGQTATIEGKIREVRGNTLVVEGKSGLVDEFPLSSNFTVYTYSPGSTEPSTSRDPKSIDLAKNWVIALQVEGNEYKIVSASHVPAVSNP